MDSDTWTRQEQWKIGTDGERERDAEMLSMYSTTPADKAVLLTNDKNSL